MATALHADLTGVEIHIPIRWVYADETARLAATGFVAADVLKFAWQQDTSTLWILTDDSPISWKQVTPDGVATATNHVDFPARKGSAGTITKGQAVYIVGYDVPSDTILVELARADSSTTMPCAGIATGSFTNSSSGTCRMTGEMEGLDTSAWAVNDFVHVDPTTAGALTDSHPTGPNLHQPVAKVAKSDAATGVLLIGVSPAYDHLSDATPAAVGAASSGTSPFISRRDHVHAHGNQSSDGNMHAVAVAAGNAGFMSGSDKTKLDGIATGAEVSKLRQSAETNLATSFSTSSTTFVDVLTLNITTQASGILNIWGTFGGTTAGNASVHTRITVDGAQVGDAIANHGHSGGTGTVATANVARVTGLSAASHTVKLQARVSASTVTADPTTTDMGAGLLVQEVTA